MAKKPNRPSAQSGQRLGLPVCLGACLALMAAFLTGCASVVSTVQPASLAAHEMLLSAQQGIGQTFVARYAGLNGIQIFLASPPTTAGDLTVTLRAEPNANAPVLAQGRLDLRQAASAGFYTIPFAKQADSAKTYYYASLQVSGMGEARLGANAADSYLDGALYAGDQPAEAQLAFNLTYDRVDLIAGLLREGGGWIRLLLAGVGLLVVPGLAVVLWAGPSLPNTRWTDTLGLALAASLAIYPVLMLLTHLIGLQLGAGYAWGPVAVGGVALAWRWRRWRPSQTAAAWQAWCRGETWPPDLVTVLLLGLIIGLRFWLMRGLDMPMWNDSYHHALIVQLMADQGGLFSNWAPYAPFDSFTYHFGFHAVSAALLWLTGSPAAQAVLWMGQLVNVAAVVALVPLARWISPNRWSAAIALAAAGLLSAMPSFYVNWGRYTQLAGQAILPAAMVLFAVLVEGTWPTKRRVALAVLVIGGLSLTHFRVLIFAVLFFGLWMLLAWQREAWRRQLLVAAIVGLGAFLIFLPWLLNTLAGTLLRQVTSSLVVPTGSGVRTRVMASYNAMFDFRDFMPAWLWLATLGTGVWSVWQRRRRALVIGLWWVALFLSANPQWFGLPGQGDINNFTIQIFSYGPAAVLLAALGELQPSPRWRAGWRLVGLVGALALCAWGTYQRFTDLRPFERILVTRPDLRAMAWIRQNVPPESLLLINGRYELVDQYVVGSDGAWLTPLLTGRQVTIPPMVYTSETLSAGWTKARILGAVDAVKQEGQGGADWMAAVRATGARYIFVGQRHGQVLNSDVALDAKRLEATPGLSVVYRQDRVWIFAVQP